MLEEHGILALLELPRIGSKTVMRLVDSGLSIDDEASFETAVKDKLPKLIRYSPPPIEEIRKAWEAAVETLFRAEEKGVGCFAITNPRYPARLKKIPDPAPILFIAGNRECLDAPCVAVIGTRSPSQFGATSAERIAKRIALSGITVISGLAEGCDTEGHKGAIHGKGKTAAVLAHGFGQIYPAANRELANEILECGGCWISEYAPGVPANRSSFVQRDRLQSGLSDAIIVIETDEKGGTMHTVSFAIQQKRELFAINHPSDKREHPKTRGNQLLLREKKAQPLSSAADIDLLIRCVLSLAERKDEQNPKECITEFRFEAKGQWEP